MGRVGYASADAALALDEAKIAGSSGETIARASLMFMIGTDHPIPWQDKSIEHVLATDTLSDAEKVAILSGNAQKLFNLR